MGLCSRSCVLVVCLLWLGAARALDGDAIVSDILQGSSAAASINPPPLHPPAHNRTTLRNHQASGETSLDLQDNDDFRERHDTKSQNLSNYSKVSNHSDLNERLPNISSKITQKKNNRLKSSRNLRNSGKTSRRSRSRHANNLPRRTSRRRVKNKSLKCSRRNEIPCPFKCISSNSICDGVRDCSDGSDEKNCNELQIGLKGGKSKGEGRVEIVMNGFKGTVCGKGWSDREAGVFCRMLGYSEGGKAVIARQHGFGTGLALVWTTKFNCKGNEEDLFECPLYKRETKCSHLHDAGVVCRQDGDSSIPNKPKATKPPINDSSKLQCGMKPIQHPFLKILGGQTATYGSQPWQARLVVRQNFRHLCGASIIHQQWVITAAHCLKNIGHKDIAVVLGDHSLTLRDDKEQVFNVGRMIVHPMFKASDNHQNQHHEEDEDYFFDDFFHNPFFSILTLKGRSYWHSRATASSFKYDIALLKLDPYKRHMPSKVTFNNHVQPLCLPDASTPYPHGLQCEISGWGYSGKNRKGSMKLQVARLSLIRQDVCEKAYGPMFFNKLPSQMVCAGSFDAQADTCQGDSGGPLACKVNGVHTLMGVTSWGFECGESKAPGIYTRVGVLRDWIDGIIGEE